MIGPGSRLGPYEVTAKLGEGGMGEVWRAADTRLKREVAIKVLPSAFIEDRDRLARFEREARLLAQLHHPNIASIFGLEESDGVRALVMELVEGIDLSDLIARGPVPIAEAISIARQIAEALEAAHERGIVHRDLKPANVKVRTDGAVKVLDFGLAKAMGPADSPAGSLNSKASTLMDPATAATPETRAGVLLGTAAYMAPEQARGLPVDERADVWAFGVLLFEMLSGRRPFGGPTLSDLLANVLRAEPDWAALPPSLPLRLRALLDRCLTRDLRRRLQSIAEARIALEDALSADEPGASPAPAVPPNSRHRELVAWTLAAVALLGLGAMLLFRGSGPAGSPPLRATKRFAVTPPAFGGFENGIALSRDGSRLAFVAPGPDGEDVVWLRPIEEVVPRPLAGTEGAAFPFWSPDGTRLAFFAKGKLKSFELTGGRLQNLCDAPNPRGGAWSGAGMLLVSIHAGGMLVTVPAAGGTPVTVIEAGAGKDFGTLRFPSFLPDGRRFLCYRFGGAAKAGLWAGRIGSRELTFVVEADSGAVFAPPGHVLYRSRERLVAHPFDAKTGKLVGTHVPVADHVWSDSIATILTAFDASDTGVVAYRTGGPARSRLLWFDRSGSPLGSLGPEGVYFEPTLSPDGRRVAVSRGSEEGEGSQVWVLETDREGLTRFSFASELASTPLWSPDGRHLAWSTFPAGQVVRKAASGAGKEEPLWKNPSFWPLSDWSSDGRHILFEVLEFSRFSFDVGRIAIQGDHRLEPLLAESFSELGARLSADGKWLAYVSDESGVEEVFVRSYPDLSERWRVSSSGGTQPRWRRDGRELFYVAPDRRIMAVGIRTEPRFEAGPPRALFQTRILPPVEARNHYDVTPDGSRFLVNSRLPDDATAPIVVVLDWAAELSKP